MAFTMGHGYHIDGADPLFQWPGTDLCLMCAPARRTGITDSKMIARTPQREIKRIQGWDAKLIWGGTLEHGCHGHFQSGLCQPQRSRELWRRPAFPMARHGSMSNVRTNKTHGHHRFKNDCPNAEKSMDTVANMNPIAVSGTIRNQAVSSWAETNFPTWHNGKQ